MKAEQQEKQHSNLKKRGKEKSQQLVYFSSLMDCSQPLYFFFCKIVENECNRWPS